MPDDATRASRTAPQVDHARLSLTREGPELVVHLAHPHALEVQHIGRGPGSLALAPSGRGMALCYRFGMLPWACVPAPERASSLPSAERPPPHAPLHVTLIDRESGEVRARRTIPLPARMGHALHDTLTQGCPTDPSPVPAGRLAQNAVLRHTF